MSRVLFFSNQFAAGSGHGVSRYVHQLFRQLVDLPGAPKITPVAAWSDRAVDDLRQLVSETGLKLLPTGRRLTPLLWTLVGGPTIERLAGIDADLVHAGSLGYPVSTAKPLVLTIHDIGHLSHPQYFNDLPGWISERSLSWAVRQAAAFICVSHASARSLMDYVLIHQKADLSRRVHVVHEGVSDLFSQAPADHYLEAVREGLGFNQPFLLAVGKISPRKNLEAIIRSLGELRENIPHHLVTVGGNGWDFQGANRLVEELDLQDRVHFLGYVSDAMLVALYHLATVFIYPSLFEGFGLPVLEAMACGCPVITSNVSSLPEVAGDAALTINPHNTGELADTILRLCTDESLLMKFAAAGQARASKFSWKRCAEQVNDIYSGLLS